MEKETWYELEDRLKNMSSRNLYYERTKYQHRNNSISLNNLEGKKPEIPPKIECFYTFRDRFIVETYLEIYSALVLGIVGNAVYAHFYGISSIGIFVACLLPIIAIITAFKNFKVEKVIYIEKIKNPLWVIDWGGITQNELFINWKDVTATYFKLVGHPDEGQDSYLIIEYVKAEIIEKIELKIEKLSPNNIILGYLVEVYKQTYQTKYQ
jgi:hypothetical protein